MLRHLFLSKDTSPRPMTIDGRLLIISMSKNLIRAFGGEKGELVEPWKLVSIHLIKVIRMLSRIYTETVAAYSFTSQAQLGKFLGGSAGTIDLLSRIGNLSSSISSFLILLLSFGPAITTHRRNNLLHNFYSGRRASWLSSKDLPALVDNEDTPSSLWTVLQANGTNQCRRWIAQQGIREVLFSLEGSVGLWAVSAKTIDAQARSRKRVVGVAEEASLRSACHGCQRCVSTIERLRVPYILA